MALEEKYQKASIDYWVSVVFRKISNSFLAYPEFIFLAKVILGLFAFAFLFFLFRKYFGF
jgi:hypothetical protein